MDEGVKENLCLKYFHGERPLSWLHTGAACLWRWTRELPLTLGRLCLPILTGKGRTGATASIKSQLEMRCTLNLRLHGI